MRNSFGNQIVTTLFGESHGKYVGCVIDGFPSGIQVDMDFIKSKLAKRRPKIGISTSRIEDDEFLFVSGVYKEKTTGCPICILVKNKDVDDNIYDEMYGKMRPSHADFTQYLKYNGCEDYRGGGHFSGRLTVSLVIAGSLAQILLKEKNIKIATHILSSQYIYDRSILNEKDVDILNCSDFPMLDNDKKGEFIDYIKRISAEGDSIGANTETAIYNLDAGLGEPWFSSVESELSKAIFGIPAIKGISFGAGFDFANMKGSEANDIPYFYKSRVKYKTNYNAGINGGITNGCPIIFNCAIKPTPSIFKEQDSIDFINKKNIRLNIKGRHDPIIANRICPVIDAVSSLVICDLYAMLNKY